MKISRIFSFLTFLLPFAVSAQVSWTSRNPAPTTLALKALAAGEGIYVAVTGQGTVVSSTDTLNWRTETFPSFENLNNVAFANGHFFARGDSGTIFVSDDGHYWLQRLGGNVANSGGPVGHNIVYGNGTYVAVSAYSGTVVTSPDTVTWTVLPGVFGDSVAFGGGIFMMVSLADSSIRTSTDGLVWTKITPAAFTSANQVAYGAGHFVVRHGSQLYQSTDTVTWTLIPGVSASSVAFVKDRFIAQNTTSQLPIISLDGVAWTAHTGATVLIPPSQIAGIGDSFVAFIGNKLYRSADAVGWTPSGVNFSTTANYPGVAFARNRFLTGDGHTSVDGITWTTGGFAVPVANATDLTIHAANDRFFAFTGGSVYVSTDGLSGTKTTDLTFNPKSIAYGNGHYVAVGTHTDGSKGGVATSTDALAWTDRSLAVNLPPLIDVEYATNLFVAVGPTGAIYTSSDGLTWTRRPHPVTSAYGNALAYGAGRWVLAGMPSLTSTDGIEWSASTAPDATAITYANGLFVLNAYWESANNFRFNPTATIATSPDGVHWTYRNTTNVNTGSFAFGNGSWVTAGNRGTLSQSSATDAALAPAFATGLSARLDPADKNHLTLEAPASGAGPISYQWFRKAYYYGDAVPLTTTSSTLSLPNWTSATGDVLTLVATNSHGSAVIPYRISSQTSQLNPTGFNIGVARSATPTTDGQIVLSLIGSSHLSFGPGPVSFQWYKDGVLIPHANASSITVPYDAAKDSDSIFTLAVTNLFGRVNFDYDLTTQITLTPSSQTQLPGAATTFTARVMSTLANSVVTFTWKKNGQTIRTVDATVGTFTQTAVDSLVLSNLQSSDYGVYQFTVSNKLGTIASDYFTLAPPSVTRLVNLSVRAHVGTGDDVLIAGFVGNGTGAGPNILARGIGPTLSTLGIAAPLARPQLALKNATGVTLATNEHWEVQTGYDAAFLRDLMTRIGAFPLLAGSADAAILRPGTLNTAQPPRFTAILSGVGNTTGVGLIEFYEFAPSSERLVNLSARARVGSGENVLIAGFVITGDKPLKLLIRGVGPTLTGQGITSPLSNPKITLFDSAGHEIHNNDQWNAAANLADLRAATTATGAFALAENSNDAAMLESLAPGVYSVHVTSVAGTSGIALVEIYTAP